MATSPTDYHHGDQDVREHQATFHLFIGMTKWGSLYLAALLVLLVTWFCTDAGFVPGFVAALVIIALGTLVLREKPHRAH